MKVDVTVYNDDKAANRTLRVVRIDSEGKVFSRKVDPAAADAPSGNFKIGQGEMLIVTVLPQ